MAIAAKFVADFSDFDKGVKNAEKTMLSFQKQVEQSGGRLMDLKGYTDKTGGGVNSLASQFKTFDNLLAAGGVNIGGAVRGLQELSQAATKTVGALGALGTGGLIIGTFLAVKQATTDLLSTFGLLNPAVEWFSNTLKGLAPDMFLYADSAERANAKLDILARASKTAGHEITNVAEAMEINRRAAELQSLAFGQSTNAARDSRVALANWQREIREARKEGNIEQLNKDLDSQNFTMQELSKTYGITVRALEYYKRTLAATTAEEQKAAQESAAINARRVAEREAQAKADAAFAETRWKQQLDLETRIIASTQKQTESVLALTNNAVLKELEATLQLTQGVAAEETAFTRLEAAQRSLQAAKVAGFSIQAQETVLMDAFGKELMEAAIAEEKARFAAQGVGEAAAAAAPAVDVATDSVISAGSAAQQTAGSFFQMSEGLYAAIRAAQQMDALAGADKGIYANTIGGIGGSSASTRWGQANTMITINGSVLGNKDEIARVVGDAVTSSYRSGGNRLPV